MTQSWDELVRIAKERWAERWGIEEPESRTAYVNAQETWPDAADRPATTYKLDVHSMSDLVRQRAEQERMDGLGVQDYVLDADALWEADKPDLTGPDG